MNLQHELNRLLTKEEVAVKIRRSVKTVERYINSGKLPVYTTKSTVLINLLDIPTYLRRKK